MILKLVKSIKKISKKCNVLADYNCPNTLSELLILPIVCLTNVPKVSFYISTFSLIIDGSY